MVINALLTNNAYGTKLIPGGVKENLTKLLVTILVIW